MFKEKKLASKKNPVDEIDFERSTHRDQIHKQSWSTNVKRTDQFVDLEAGKMIILKYILNTYCEMAYEIHAYQAGPVGSCKPEGSIK